MQKKVKGLVAINDILDSRFKKLSDKYHDLQLSHNRKKKVLEWIVEQFTPPSDVPVGSELKLSWVSVMTLIGICDNALFSDGRVNEKPIKARKNNA